MKYPSSALISFFALIAFASCATMPDARVEDLNAPVNQTSCPAEFVPGKNNPREGDPKDAWSSFATFSMVERLVVASLASLG